MYLPASHASFGGHPDFDSLTHTHTLGILTSEYHTPHGSLGENSSWAKRVQETARSEDFHRFQLEERTTARAECADLSPPITSLKSRGGWTINTRKLSRYITVHHGDQP